MRNLLGNPSLVLVLVGALVGCGGKEDVSVSGDDTGIEDGTTDGSTDDTGGGGDSATPIDTGTPTDTGLPSDTGVPPTDTGADVITPVDGGCPTGLSVCGAACVDLTKDLGNCGGCGKACPTGGSCTAGVCACPTGQIICGSKCVDPTSDAANCGACGKSCGAVGTCTSGVCGCAAPGTSCGTPALCVDTTKDPRNCGGCGKTCGTWGVCSGSACSCPTGTSVCATGGGGGGATCADTLENARFCGKTGCGTACGDRDYCDGTGTCACKPGLTACSFGGGGTTCLNTQSSPNACGGCGKVCTAGQTCVAGVCTSPTGGTPPACPTGTTRCAIGGGGGGGGFSGCYDLTKDNTACGECGRSCAANEMCVNGACKVYGVAPACTTCPCADCATFVAGGGEGATCCPALPGHKHALCVRGAACPK